MKIRLGKRKVMWNNQIWKDYLKTGIEQLYKSNKQK